MGISQARPSDLQRPRTRTLNVRYYLACILCLSFLITTSAAVGAEARKAETIVVVASWYGHAHHGKPMSGDRGPRNGPRHLFNMYDRVVASNTLPLGTIVTLTNLHNGNIAERVTVCDFGPRPDTGRKIDASFQVAHELGYIENGHTKLRVEVTYRPRTPAELQEAREACANNHVPTIRPEDIPPKNNKHAAERHAPAVFLFHTQKPLSGFLCVGELIRVCQHENARSRADLSGSQIPAMLAVAS